jgi:HlyD family secretion protein
MFKGFLRYISPARILLVVATVALVSVGVVYTVSLQKPSATYSEAKISNVSDEIDATGAVQAADSLDLSFDVSGRVASIPAKVGQHVYIGETLASLSAADVAANLSQAKANLAIQQAKLAGLKAGPRPEDLAVSQTAVNGAQNNLAQTKQSLLSASQDAYVKADDAIHNRVDMLFDSPRSAQPHLNVTFTNSSLQNSVTSDRIQMETQLSQWQSFLKSTDADETATTLATTRKNLAAVSSYLDNVAAGLSTVTPSAGLSVSTIQSYQSSIATARTNLSASLSAINVAATSEQAAESALASAQSQYSLTQVGALPTDVEAQQAAVDAAQASVDLASANLSKTVIRAPINGTVVRNEAHLGETVAPGVP